MIGEIMNAPGFGEVMFLVAVILFIIEVVRLVAVGDDARWGYHWLLVVAGLAALALGWLALPTGN